MKGTMWAVTVAFLLTLHSVIGMSKSSSGMDHRSKYEELCRACSGTPIVEGSECKCYINTEEDLLCAQIAKKKAARWGIELVNVLVDDKKRKPRCTIGGLLRNPHQARGFPDFEWDIVPNIDIRTDLLPLKDHLLGTISGVGEELQTTAHELLRRTADMRSVLNLFQTNVNVYVNGVSTERPGTIRKV